MMFGMRDEGVAAVERYVQDFVTIGCPGVREFAARSQMCISIARSSPETERTVDVNPGAKTFRNRNQGSEIVEGSGGYVACLHDHDGWRAGVYLQRRFEISRIDPTQGVDGKVYDVAAAEP